MTSPTPAPAVAPAPAPAPAPVQFSAAQLAQLLAPAPPPAAAAPAPAAPAPVVAGFSADQVMQLMAFLQGQAPAAAPAPAEVNPTALPIPGQPAVTQVKEQPLYRFDGNPAQRCLISDLKSQFGGDHTLRGKAEEFVGAAMAKAFAAIATTDVNELNPAIQRPDLYVPKLEFARPLGAMTQGGVVTSLTQSVFPKYNSDSGLVGAHTPGTEPTEGAATTTSATVTPVGLSGKVIVQREVIDQGGSPQVDQVLWGLMTQAYAEALEGRVEALLDGLALTPQAVVGVDEILSASLLAKLVALQYVRGGDRYSAWGIHSAFYAALAGAVDSTGRHLFPMDAPSNVNGGTAGDLSSVRAHGKIARPAWALETANGGPATPVSYLWVPSSVYQWFSAPRRIDLNAIAVATVEIGIWGYSAEFVLRDTDVIELTYAPA